MPPRVVLARSGTMLNIDHGERIDRRTALVRAAVALSAGCVLRTAHAAGSEPERIEEPTEQQIHEYLRPLLLSREDVDAWLKQQAFPFAKYDAELGYLHRDREFPEGMDGSVCRYR